MAFGNTMIGSRGRPSSARGAELQANASNSNDEHKLDLPGGSEA